MIYKLEPPFGAVFSYPEGGDHDGIDKTNLCSYEEYHAARLLVFAAIITRNISRRQKPRRSEGSKKGAGSAFFTGKAKPPNGEPGCPRPHDLAARPGARSSALYRPDNSTIKCPARHVGPGILAGGETAAA